MRRFVAAFNDRDMSAVLSSVHDDVVFAFGPRSRTGRDEIRNFVERQLHGAAYRVEHRREYHAGSVVVAEARFELIVVETGELAEVEVDAALYVVDDGGLRRFQEFPDVAAALSAAGMSADGGASATERP